jgi:dihydroorotate dehydrogenase electron transfer subunit
MVFLSEQLLSDPRARWKPLVLMGSEIPFPFRTRPSRIMVPAAPAEAIACMPLLDEWGVASRLASNAGYPGCFAGHVTELASHWLAELTAAELAEVAIYACGPTAMLAATAKLARACALPCQVALEEFMACAVGGCAGCAVEVRSAKGRTMQRVCVDGPVFDAHTVYWD